MELDALEREWEDWDESVAGYKRKKKECKDCGKMVYNLPRHCKQKHSSEALQAGNRGGQYCFVCKKVRKCMKSHLKVIHKIPRDFDDFKKLYAIFTKGEEDTDDENPVVEKADLFLDEFELHQRGQTGGRQSSKHAKQNRKQAEAILKHANQSLPEFFQDLEEALYSEEKGFFPEQVDKNNWKIGTVRSYLFSLKRYLDFLITKKQGCLDAMTGISATTTLDKLIASTAKDVSSRRHEHAMETRGKLLSASQIEAYLDSSHVKEIAAVLNLTTKDGASALGDKAITNCRTYLAAHTLIHNGQRTGVILNAKLSEFRNGDKVEDGKFIFHVAQHKTSGTYGPAVIVLDKKLYHYYRIYLKKIRPNLVKGEDPNGLFLNNDGTNLSRQTFNNNIRRHFEQAINVKNVSPTLLRMSLVSIMEKAGTTSEDMAKLAHQFTHSTQTQQRWYAIDRGIKKAVSAVKVMEDTRKDFSQEKKSDPLDSTEEDDNSNDSQKKTPMSQKETSEEEEDDELLEVREEEEAMALQVCNICYIFCLMSV